MSDLKSDIFIDPAGAFVSIGQDTYYRDGIINGYLLEKAFQKEVPLSPELWSMVVAKYRTRTQSVEAIQLDEENLQEVAKWCGGLVVSEDAMNVPTLTGGARAGVGDYVIKDEDGRFSVMSEVEFSDKYEIG